MEEVQAKRNTSFMLRLATLIVDKRNLIFLFVAIALVFSAFSRNWVQVENDLTAFLSPESDTRKGLDLMRDQFVTFGTADVMVSSISFAEAEALADEIRAIPGVQSVAFDDTTDHYARASALFSITFDYDEQDGRYRDALDAVMARLESYDTFLRTDLGDTLSDIIAAEVRVIMIYVAVIVVAVLLLTSRTYAEVPVLLLTFVFAAILNLGTNFLFGTISFVSNSVTTILQLALSLDYAVIFSNRFKEEHQTLPIREAAIVALSKAIPEIGASSLTTIGGLVAMLFMQFKLGPDMGICLIKAIFFALLSVFLIMPGLLVLFGPWMDRTEHRSFIPKIPFVGKYAYATRFVIPPVFLVVLVLGIHFSRSCPFVYGYDTLTTPRLNETQIADQMIRDTFSSENMLALVVPAGDYEKEAKLLSSLDALPEVKSTMGLANIEAMDGYRLTDKLTPRQFSELTDMDYEIAQLLYTAYAVDNESYGKLIGGISTYSVPLIDIFRFACDEVDEGYVTLDADLDRRLHDAREQMENGLKQLQSAEYSRMLVYLDLPTGSDETYAFTDRMRETGKDLYPDGDVYVVGNSTNQYEFKKSFTRDNVVVSIVSILIVLTVLLFTFKSVGMPLLLILVIQGSIWINFAIPALTHSDVFFMTYLVVSAIQMGANIDYAIVIASRYMEDKKRLDRKEAIIDTMNFAFPTIITSGTILAVAGTLIGRMTSEPTIMGIGQSIGQGTLISIALVMLVLPQILLLGSSVVERTSFSMHSSLRLRSASGRVRVDGIVHGEIHGTVTGTVHALVDGDVDLRLVSGSLSEEEGDGHGE